jgi:hypothetical protein
VIDVNELGKDLNSLIATYGACKETIQAEMTRYLQAGNTPTVQFYVGSLEWVEFALRDLEGLRTKYLSSETETINGNKGG